MEEPALRAVPVRLPGPLDPAHGLALVEATLPDLDLSARRAFALVDLGGHRRSETAAELGISETELARLLALARKSLRRTRAALPSDGWCERAELLISDRLDHALTPRGRKRLDAHLAGCDRCAEHERQLFRAHDELVESYLAAHAPAPRPVAARPAELRLVDEPPEPRNFAIGIRVALAIVLLLVVALVALAATGVLQL